MGTEKNREVGKAGGKRAATGEITRLLKRVKNGDADAEVELLALVYPELKRIAASRLRRESSRDGLQTTELVNEAYLRVFGAEAQVDWQNRAHFFAVIAQKVRFILVDHARKRRSGGHVSVELDDSLRSIPAPEKMNHADIADIDLALQEFEKLYPRPARVVELRYFVGMTMEEIAEVMDVNITSVKRYWNFARSWLYDKLKSGGPAPRR
jgi:RNA polymerase sigma factor (TIGR02999 family)